MKDKLNFNKIVFISHKASEAIEKPDSTITHCMVGDIVENITHAIPTESEETPVIATIFVHESEYASVRDTISIFKQWNFLYGFSVFIEDSSVNNPLVQKEDIFYIWTEKLKPIEFRFAVLNTFAALQRLFNREMSSNEYLARLMDMKQDQDNLIKIGRNLSIEKNSDKLLRLILKMSKTITGADAGSIYIIESNENDTRQIRFKYSHTFSKELPLEEFVLPFDRSSISGYVACTGITLNIPDVYELSADDPIAFNDSFDKQNNYRSCSMLVIPMKNHTDEIIGVIQLINSKKNDTPQKSTGNEAFEIILETSEDFRSKVFPFAKRYEGLMESVAGQAAIALENTRLFNQIQNQFEEFVKASVNAIESRDPATSGHSFRVAEICKRMALYIHNSHIHPWAETEYSPTQLKELEYAALLHDFGKVYVELAIFRKDKKLFPEEFENLVLKLDFLYRSIELQYRIQQNEILIARNSGEKDQQQTRMEKIDNEMTSMLNRVKEIKLTLTTLNEPTPLEEDPSDLVGHIHHEISTLTCCDISGKTMSILTDREIENLSIRRGSLNREERLEIENHVVHTYNFVKRIPWPKEFKNIPEIAWMHHEKLDGTGYPRGVTESKIPVGAQIMAIADIYDALTASDRPYKKALSHERAMQILQSEADLNKISMPLLEVFKDAGITNKNLEITEWV
ncbi:MAG: HD domain-containing protein [Spirochaetes bacterium]|jgi:HD-GYP domain-containing protein (c-di-GMP phosphodiesterase class II)|nr:HD domain-containing protein [Spirochaetota bacterium]